MCHVLSRSQFLQSASSSQAKEGNRGGCREQIKVIKALGWDIERTSNISIWKRMTVAYAQ